MSYVMIVELVLTPLAGLLVSTAVLYLVGYFNWKPGLKEKSIGWIQRMVFRNSFDSRSQAEGVFNVATSQLLVGAGLVMIASLYILSKFAG